MCGPVVCTSTAECVSYTGQKVRNKVTNIAIVGVNSIHCTLWRRRNSHSGTVCCMPVNRVAPRASNFFPFFRSCSVLRGIGSFILNVQQNFLLCPLMAPLLRGCAVWEGEKHHDWDWSRFLILRSVGVCFRRGSFDWGQVG